MLNLIIDYKKLVKILEFILENQKLLKIEKIIWAKSFIKKFLQLKKINNKKIKNLFNN